MILQKETRKPHRRLSNRGKGLKGLQAAESAKGEALFKTSSFYGFFNIPKARLKTVQSRLKQEGKKLNIKGLVLIGAEGVNVSVCAPGPAVEKYKAKMETLFQKRFFYKDGFSKTETFRRFFVKIKPEIITVGRPGLLSDKAPGAEPDLSPEQWDAALTAGDCQILDVRNDYETAVGRFYKARDLRIKRFSAFPKKIDQAGLDKNKKTLIYCTGGIRCEKALKIMKGKGFKEVCQLKGGILHYLSQKPRSFFEGECFVFDRRLALDQELRPSRRFSHCPGCGQTGDIKTFCAHCAKPFQICRPCLQKAEGKASCSKNCAYHFKAGHTCRNSN